MSLSGSPSSSISTPLAIHLLSSTFILPSSHPSSLQTYSPSTFGLIAELEVSPSNRVSRRDSDHVTPCTVEHAFVSHTGQWLATVDRREGDESFRGEIYLKIWRWDSKTGSWMLNTRVNSPHGLRKVTNLAFSPVNDHLVTAGEDGQVKSWKIRETKHNSGYLEGVIVISEDDPKLTNYLDFWIHRSTVAFRAMTPLDVSWSADGSILAVTFNACVALYDATSNALRSVVTSSECRSLTNARFVGSAGRYLLLAADRDLVLWDLVHQTSKSIRLTLSKRFLNPF
jgi:NET1-associated nuclear protein 1 (U3 small nucleolar RNA-associated protein 17)